MHQRAVFFVVASSLFPLFGCGQAKTPVPPAPATVRTTYRVIGGVSMGAIGSSALGLTHPERFDGIAPLGGPLDAAFFSRMLDRFVLGGFCTRAELEAIAAQDPVKLNDPAVINACARPATPMKWEHANDFNHWHVTNNGGTFDRDAYLRMMGDLTLAYGNFFTDNAASPYAPPGVDPEKVRHVAADFCTSPVKVSGLRNLEYNPDGTYDAITFCDGQPDLYFCATGEEPVDFCSDPANVATPLPVASQDAFANAYCANKGGAVLVNKNDNALYWLKHAGQVDPCRQPARPVGMMLAFDYNHNGRRDYGEPVLNNSHERYDDVGADGCANAFEDGKGGCTTTGGASGDPNHDDYDPDTNPAGTENDWKYEKGEPFRDDGLDGVPNTHDQGEGNGTFDQNAGRTRLFALDGRTNFTALDATSQKRINLLTDGGIRDIFNLGLMAKFWFGAVAAVRGIDHVLEVRDFAAIPGMADRVTGAFTPWNHSWTQLPRDLLTLYGKEMPTDAEFVQGEGDHVGTPGEAVDRFQIVFNWVANMWPSLPRPETPFQDTTNRNRLEYFQSTKLGAKWEYAIALPPGYNDPANAQVTYPVAYLLHGYGMEPNGFSGTSAITDIYVSDTSVQLRPVIYVYPNGRCCYVKPATGERDCRNQDDTGASLDSVPGWERECNSGTFWVNRQGFTPTDGTLYGDAFFELMDHIDATYRTTKAAEVEAR